MASLGEVYLSQGRVNLLSDRHLPKAMVSRCHLNRIPLIALSITHNLHSYRYAELDIREAREPPPHDGVAGGGSVARAIAAELGDFVRYCASVFRRDLFFCFPSLSSRPITVSSNASPGRACGAERFSIMIQKMRQLMIQKSAIRFVSAAISLMP